MPYHAKLVSNSTKLMWTQVAVAAIFAFQIFYSYVSEIPEGENGSVIIGMFVVIPFVCFLSQVSVFVVHYILRKLAYNKPLKSRT